MLEVTLKLDTPEGTRYIPVSEGRLTIGRDDAANLCLADPGLSRLHASLYREGDRVWVSDEGSLNGSYVNGAPIPNAGHTLIDRDKISLGDYTTLWVSITRTAAEPSMNAEQKKPSPGLPLAPLLMAVGVCLILAIALAVKWVGSRAATRDPVVAPDRQLATETGNANARVDPPPQTENANATIASDENKNHTSSPTASAKLYRQLNESEKMDFVMRQAERISRKMGNRPCNFTPGALQRIKAFVDGYASRIGHGVDRAFQEDLRVVYQRATRFAPLVIRAFNKCEVYPEVGLYMAMIESEYHKCLESWAHAKGMFQFMPGTARDFGISPEERCDEEKMAPAAGKYFKQLIGQFGTDAFSVALAIASYNRGPGWISSDLHKVVESRDERSFWTLVENAESLPSPFQKETIKYVPKFFAAAIIGENPGAFGLQMRELSTYTQAPDSQ